MEVVGYSLEALSLPHNPRFWISLQILVPLSFVKWRWQCVLAIVMSLLLLDSIKSVFFFSVGHCSAAVKQLYFAVVVLCPLEVLLRLQVK